ncbi:MAG TPA: hypothetical protein PKZ72_10735 [Saprospiraceae bacterium]|nr:hypothetical protein [Saprospiraceae bacterium]HNB82249.1 hypothetical protein [Chitinophagaceae bacterium]HNF72027.1 hypothetical protein [Chitinophagaceae bacterium]
MTRNQETGHARNVANFAQLIQAVIQLGSGYTPSSVSLSLSNLQSAYELANQAVLTVHEAVTENRLKMDARRLLFTQIRPVTHRILAALVANGISKESMEHAISIKRKIFGRRAHAKVQATESETEVKTHSVSQLSFDLQADNFNQLITFIEAIPAFQPLEADLKASALRAFYSSLVAQNQAVSQSVIQVDQKRIERNKILYDANTGLVPTAIRTREYITSVFGIQSPQSKNVRKIFFKVARV